MAENEKLSSVEDYLNHTSSSGIQKTLKRGSIIPFGGYDWRVLYVDEQNNEALLLSEKIIEKRAYHASKYDITWAKCDLSDYLNSEFYNTFSENDKARIAKALIKTDDNPWWGTRGGRETMNNIFLLSIEEVVKCFGDSRQLENMDSKNKWSIDDQYNAARRATDVNGMGEWWWLRSPGVYTYHAATVEHDGSIYVYGAVNSDSGGVRPALWLNM